MKIIEDKEFTTKQLQILALKENRHLVLAPPGSGKTQLLSQRIINAMNSGVNPQKMICVTFTNRAARNMNDRVGELGMQTPFIGTLHKFGYKFLLANHIIPASTALLDEEDSHQFLNDAVTAAKDKLKEKFIDINLFDAANYIREFNKERLNLKKVLEQRHRSEILDQIAVNYNEIKKECCVIDFDDVLHLTLHSLRFKKPTELCNYQWIQVDEVQDLSSLQWDIITNLISAETHVVFFGDYDQSIYSFMGASQETLAQCTKGITEHHLQDNFRSPQYLIDFFNAYAQANMPARKISSLKFNSKNTNTGGKVRVHHSTGVFNDEASDIATKIIPHLISELQNIAILTRTNKDADSISLALKKNHIDHKKVSGFDLFQRRTIKDVMSFLNAFANPQNRISWTRLLSIFGDIGSLKASREMVNEVFSVGMSPEDWIVNKDMSDMVDVFDQSITSGRCIVFDTETTGLTTEDDIIQIAAAELINGIPTGKIFEAFITTGKDISNTVNIHHITQDVLNAKGIPPSQAYAKFLAFVNDSPLAGHNVISFDLPMLEANLARADIRWNRPEIIFDTLTLTKRLYPQIKSYRLSHLIKFLNLEGENTHNAIDDVMATVSLIVRLTSESKLHKQRRIEVKKNYGKFISRFASNLSPLWEKYINHGSLNLNLGDVVDDFFIYSKQAIKYNTQDEEVEHIQTLVSYLKNYTPSNSFAHLLKNLLRELTTYSEADLITDDVKVVVSTVHKAKGLEFEGVVLTSCVQDVYPNYYSTSVDAIHEDARLFYVGLTRAKKEIVLTTHDTVVNRGGRFSRYPSPFLEFL